MKKGASVFVLLLGIVFFSGFASAYGYFPSVRQGMESVVTSLTDIFEPILSGLFAGQGWTGTLLFERALIFILLIAIIYIVLGKISIFEQHKAVRWIVAVIVPLIGMRFMDYSSLVEIINQYMLLAVIFTAVIPFVLYFYFLYEIAGDHGIIRKLGWLVFVGIYIGLWSTSDAASKGGVYFWTFIAALVCLFGDTFIYRRFRYIQLLKHDAGNKALELAKINKEIQDTNNLIRSGALNRIDGEKHISELLKLKKWLARQA